MKKSYKYGLMGVVGIATIGILASCNSFCSPVDSAHYRYAYDPINTTFYSSKADCYEDILDNFETYSNVDLTKVTVENLIFNDGNRNYKYGDAEFEEKLLTTYNENLYSVNPGELTIKSATNPDSNNKRSDIVIYSGLNEFTTTMFNNQSSYAYVLPSYDFIKAFDAKLLTAIEEASNKTLATSTYEDIYGYTSEDLKTYNSTKDEELLKTMVKGREEKSLLANYGYLKHYSVVKDEQGNETVSNTQKIIDWNNELALELGHNEMFSTQYLTVYEQTLSQKVAAIRTCIAVEDGFYGLTSNDPLNQTVKIEGKARDFWGDWGKAFTQHGFLEGLLVYPIAVGVENLSHTFGMNGWGQIGALLLMTLIVRLSFMLITLPSTISQQKMQFLQPEIAKLQQKYPNSQTNQYDKERLAQAQMALYKKHNVHPYRSFLVMIVQFPLFIAVWNALQGSASLSSDAVLGLNLSASIWNTLINFSGWPGNAGWWTALILILLMSAGQIFAMLIPNWLNKKRIKNVEKVNKSETADKAQNQMKWMQWIMTAFIIIMGFNLPAAMGVYWLAGALFSIFQSLIMHFVFMKQKSSKK